MIRLLIVLLMLSLGLMSCDLADEVDDAIIDISGRVSHDGNSISGAIVLLVEGTDVSGVNLANGSFTDNSGNYLILDVDPGNYYVIAVDDANGNLEYDEGTDRLGIHGIDLSLTIPDVTPEQIEVDEEDLEDIDITYLEG